MSAVLMVCGTGSDVGKSQLVTGLCRLFARRGIRVAPFKGQNMALNSVVTADRSEIGRAQATQATAAGTEPEAVMNPVLLKPTSDRTSQVIVRGRVWRSLDAAAFHDVKPELVPVVDGALAELRARFELVLCEGAGSPAEINLFDHDLVNLGLAVRNGVPAILVGDIDRGGVFAHLYGTVALLPDDRRSAIRGFVINKFRGDRALLGNATSQLEGRSGIPTLGVLPYLQGLWLDAEDSMALMCAPGDRGDRNSSRSDPCPIDVVVIRFPTISNFTDFDPLLVEPELSVRYVSHPATLGDPDLIILPGTKSTVADLTWLATSGIVAGLESARRRGSTILGICGGYQMLGQSILDPEGVESSEPHAAGLSWLRVVTTFEPDKITVRRKGEDAVSGSGVDGYEIHHGRPSLGEGATSWIEMEDGSGEGCADEVSGVFGTSLHDLFERDVFRSSFLLGVAARRNRPWSPSGASFARARELQIDRLADACEQHLEVDRILEFAANVPEVLRS